MTKETAESGVKVVGATAPGDTAPPTKEPKPKRKARRGETDRAAPSRRAFRLVSLLAVIGLIGTVVFGILYTTKSSSGGTAQDPAVVQRVPGLPDRLLQLQRQDG